MNYFLPTEAVTAFPDLFSELENKQLDLRVLGFGASVASQEKVFQRYGVQII